MMRRSLDESRKFASCPGDRFYIEKHGEVLPNGVIKLVPDKEIDIQEKYNSEYPATTIDNILANSSPLQNFADDGLSGIDATKLPSTFAEFLQLQIDRKREFDRLPVEVKQKFDNDLNKFMATAGTEEWFNKLGIDVTVKKEPEAPSSASPDSISKE